VEVNERRVWKLMRGPATSPRRGVALQSLEGLPSHVVTVAIAKSGLRLKICQTELSFHPDYYFPRILNPSEKGAETSSSQPPTADRSLLLFHGSLPSPLVYMFVSSHVLADVANAAPSQATVEIHHTALSSLPQPLRLRPPG
jgi:hypothetical protein